MSRAFRSLFALTLTTLVSVTPLASAQVAVHGGKVYTMAGPPIENGVVVIRDGKIAEVGPADTVTIPAGFRTMDAAVITPGLVDAHGTVGLTGIYNQAHDQDQLERSAPIQPELRAIDAYNSHEALIDWVRGFGVTTVHTSHAPGELVSGQSMVVKTTGNTVDDAIVLNPAAIAATVGSGSLKHEKGKSPGTRGKQMAMIRAELIKAQEYLKKRESAEEDKKPARDLRLDALGRVLQKELPLMVTANRVQDIATALRLAAEFDIRIWLDSAAESYLLIDEIKAAGVPVLVHPMLARAYGDMENLSFETAAKLKHAGIAVANQSGFEDYVPKTRVVLFEAAISAANGLSFEAALATITIDAARILGVADRVGSIEPGKDGDLALYDGDPFEYTSHCVGTIIDGKVLNDTAR